MTKNFLFLLLFSCTLAMARPACHLPEKPSVAVQTAAQELEHYLGKVLGDSHGIVCAGQTTGDIWLGDSKAAEALGLKCSALAEEEYVIRSSGKDIVIIGGGHRGTLYGAYHFLEEMIGVHWLTPTVEHVPAPRDYEFPSIAVRRKPFFRSRSYYYVIKHDEGRFNRRNKLNDVGFAQCGWDYGWGGGTVHTFDQYCPAAKYFEQHPEYFSEVDGKRVGGQFNGQLCLTNPEMKRVFIENLLAAIEKDKADAKAAGRPAHELYDISQNDNWNACKCKNCAAETEKYGASGALLRFVNDIAAKVSEKHPGLLFSTLAYFYTEDTPKGGVVPAPNVVIRLCDTSSNQTLGINAPGSEKFRSLILEWNKICGNLFIWAYGISYSDTGLPFPSELTYGESHRFFAEHGVKGLFSEHERAFVADVFPLKLWMDIKLMDDPFADADKLVRLFCTLYYGAAADHIIEYRRLLRAAALRNNGFVNSSGYPDQFKYIDMQTAIAAQAVFDEAEKAVAGDAELLMRVHAARRGIDMITIRFAKEYAAEFARIHGGKQFPLSANDIAERFASDWKVAFKDYDNLKQSDIDARANSEIIRAKSTSFKPFKEPEKFAGMEYYDFTMDKCNVSSGSGLEFAKDEEADNGIVVKATLDDSPKRYYDLPFAVGVYDPFNANLQCSFDIKEFEKDGKYHWYKVGTAKSPKGYVYLTRSWCVQALLNSQLDQKRQWPDCVIWVRIKAVGPKFCPGSTEKDAILIDRVTLVAVSENQK